MSPFLEFVDRYPAKVFETGQIVIEEREWTEGLYVLVSGQVEIMRQGVRLAKASEPGVVFGEVSLLLGCHATATVRAMSPVVFSVIDQPREFLLAHPEVTLYVAQLLAQRLDSLNKYLVDVKRQYEGHDHLGMVDEVLGSLMHRPSRITRQ